MTTILLAAGFVLVFEGLVFALVPSRLEDMLKTLEALPVEARRLIGLTGVAVGVCLLWVARSLGAG